MIVNEIAKFENRDQPRFELLLVAELGEALLVAIRSGRLRSFVTPPLARSIR